MRWMDVTLPLRAGIPCWPGDPPYETKPVSRISRGDGSNVTYVAMASHCGTHVDAPRHFIDDGLTVDQLSLDILAGPAFVLDLSGLNRNIEGGDLDPLPEGVRRLLIRTANSLQPIPEVFDPHYIGLTESAARRLAQRGVLLVGLDAWSVAAMGPGLSTVHDVLLSRPGAVLLESVCLKDVRQGWYELMCLPMLLMGMDGAPARVLLGEEKP